MLLNPEFRAVEVEPTVDGAIARSTHEVVVPIAGITLRVNQEEIWDRGSQCAELSLTAPGYPAQGSGRLTLIPNGASTAVDVDAALTVSVPFIGRHIEAKAAEVFVEIISDIESKARVWLASH